MYPVYPIYVYEWIDVKDEYDKWYEAQVYEIDHNDNTCHIHYKGLKSKYDEWFSMDPTDTDAISMAPIGTHTAQLIKHVPIGILIYRQTK